MNHLPIDQFVSMTDDGLPDYTSPPVVETILGVQFDTIEGLTPALMGAFWTSLRTDWPSATEAPFVESRFERFHQATDWSKPGIQLRQGHPPFRLQLRNDRSDEMVQIQNSRLHFNWLGYDGAVYPHYPAVRSRFKQLLDTFELFLDSERLGKLSPNQWEITYINHIPKGTVWNTPSDWKFIRFLGDTTALDGIADFEGFQGGWRFALPEEIGRLHVTWKTGRRHLTNTAAEEDIVILEQTARGPLDRDGSQQTLLSALDNGRAVIVESFRRLMTDQANSYWGLQE